MADETQKTEKKVREVVLDLRNPEKFILSLHSYSNGELAQVLGHLTELREHVLQCGRAVLAEMERRLPEMLEQAAKDPAAQTDPLKRELLAIARDMLKQNTESKATDALADLPVGEPKTWH